MAAVPARCDLRHHHNKLPGCPTVSENGTSVTISLGPTNGTALSSASSNSTSSVLSTGVTSNTQSLFSMTFHTAAVRTSSADSSSPSHLVAEISASERPSSIPSSHSLTTTHFSSSSLQQTAEASSATTTTTQASSSSTTLPTPSETPTSSLLPGQQSTLGKWRQSDVTIISASVGAPFGVFMMLLLVVVLRKCRKRPANHRETRTSDPPAHAPQVEPPSLDTASETTTMRSSRPTSGKRFSSARMSSRPIAHITSPSSTTTLVDRPPPLEPNRRPPSPPSRPPSPDESPDSAAQLPREGTEPRHDDPGSSTVELSESDSESEWPRETDAGSLPYPLRERQPWTSAGGLPPAYEDLPPRRLAPNRL
ncbi:hypothetical protein FKP32DRAFT_1762598 [Trametes sanguinea]|nr:hypothetical protein FKP32DRAFT_1762598 [Trametes sanguinea]